MPRSRGSLTALLGLVAAAGCGGGSDGPTGNVTSGPCSNARVTATIGIPQTVSGTLTATDCLWNEVARADGYRFVTSAPTTISVTASGASVLPLVFLGGSDINSPTDFDVASGPGQPARLFATVPAGTHYLWVASNPFNLGEYTLSTRIAERCDNTNFTGSIAVDQTVTGSISPTSCFAFGEESRVYRFTLATASPIRFTLRSTEFPPDLYIAEWSPGFGFSMIFTERAINDTSVVANSYLSAGEYFAVVSSRSRQLGGFTLARSEPPITVCSPTPSITLSVPGTRTDTLTSSDCSTRPGYFTKPIRFDVASSSTLQIDLTSADFDAYLQVAELDGPVIAEDDDSGVGTNSRITRVFAPGSYVLLPTSFFPSGTGQFTVSIAVVGTP